MTISSDVLFTNVVEQEFCEVREYRVLGSSLGIIGNSREGPRLGKTWGAAQDLQ